MTKLRDMHISHSKDIFPSPPPSRQILATLNSNMYSSKEEIVNAYHIETLLNYSTFNFLETCYEVYVKKY